MLFLNVSLVSWQTRYFDVAEKHISSRQNDTRIGIGRSYGFSVWIMQSFKNKKNKYNADFMLDIKQEIPSILNLRTQA